MEEYNYHREPVTFPFPTESPALPAQVYVPLTTILIICYGVLFILAYIQLVLIWYYKHKRFSYQTSLLFLILFWSTLRITLFSFYFKNAQQANQLIFVFYFFLYCLPVVLQFCTFSVLVLYYGQVYFKIAARNKKRKYSLVLRAVISISILVFFASSVVTAYLTRLCSLNSDETSLFQITLTRVCIDGFLFLSFSLILSCFLFKLARLSVIHILPEQNNLSVCKALLVSVTISFCLLTRTAYNLLSINAASLKLPGFDFDWINVSDQADLVNLTETNKFISFFCVLAIWELIPSFVIICLFRLRRNDSVMNVQASHSFAQKSVFVDSVPYEPYAPYDDHEDQRYLIDGDINYGRGYEGSERYDYRSINAD